MPEKDNKYFPGMIAVRDNIATPFMSNDGFVVNEPHVDPDMEVRLDDGVMGLCQLLVIFFLLRKSGLIYTTRNIWTRLSGQACY